MVVGVTVFIPLSLANLIPFHEPLLHVLLPLLVDPKALSVRKRAYMALCEWWLSAVMPGFEVLVCLVLKNTILVFPSIFCVVCFKNKQFGNSLGWGRGVSGHC